MHVPTSQSVHSNQCLKMKLLILYLCLAAVIPFVLSHTNTNTGCSVKIPREMPRAKTPVYLTENEELWPMSPSSHLTWPVGGKSKVFCPGPLNELTLST